MGASSPTGKFSIEGGRLTVRGEVTGEDQDAFSGALRELLRAGHDELVVDLTHASLVSASQITCIALFMMDAGGEGRSVVVTAGSRIASYLKATGLDMLGEIRVAAD